MSKAPKFVWFEAMNEDAKLTAAQRQIIGYCGIKYARDPDYIVRVKQETIAANLGCHVNTVANAFKAGQRRGWLCKVAQHVRGPGHHGADTWELRQPTPSCGPYDEWPTRDGQMTHTDSSNDPHEELEWPTRVNASTSENDVPKGLEEGFLEKGLEQGTSAGARNALAREDVIDGVVVDDDQWRAQSAESMFRDIFGESS